jgi:hypothetical protein
MNICLHCGSPVKNKFCNVSCQNYYQKKGKKLNDESIRKRSETNKKKWITLKTDCFTCNSTVEVKQRNKKELEKDKYFCSRKCANTFSSNVNKEKRLERMRISMKDNPKVIESAKKARDVIKKISESKKLDIECLHCKESIRTSNKNRKYHKECWLKISGGIREGSSRGKSGRYKGYWCDSSYELAYVIHNLDHGISFERNLEGFNYEFQNRIRKFYPDFISNGSYVEIKNFRSEETNAKISQFPHKIDIFYKEYVLENFIPYVVSKYGKDFIRLYE